MNIFIVILICYFVSSEGKEEFGPGKQDWGYVKVREYAHTFWWLYYTTADVNERYYERPLIIWLQGGPGQSSTGYGNFMEIGPLDVNLDYRNHTWVQYYNVLFIDSPVGSGFSYVEHPDYYSKTNAQTALDLLTFIEKFYQMFPQLSSTPTFIATESYGGKMTVEFANLWYKEQDEGRISSNLRGIALGSPWISPMHLVMEYAPSLLYAGMIDKTGYDVIEKISIITKDAFEQQKWREAHKLLSETELLISNETNEMDLFNFMSSIKLTSAEKDFNENSIGDFTANIDRLAFFMNTVVKSKLNLDVYWGQTAAIVNRMLEEDFMKSVVDQVESLLNSTDINVYVFNGQLDVAVNVVGTLKWMGELHWKNAVSWRNARRKPLIVDDVIEGYVKEFDRLKMFWINRAGHMAVADNPAAVLEVLKDLIDNS